MSDTPAVRHWAIIPAAGRGRRMHPGQGLGEARPKQYLELGGRTVIEHTLEVFFQHPAIDAVVVALDSEDHIWPSLALKGSKPLYTVTGGAARHQSVFNALRFLARHAAPYDWVLVHDAARPCLSWADLDHLIEVLATDPVGGILAAPVRDTLKRATPSGLIETTIDRTHLWHALTPQMFRFEVLYRTLQRVCTMDSLVTDEAAAVEQAGLPVRLVEGNSLNIKITYPEDLALAGLLLSQG